MFLSSGVADINLKDLTRVNSKHSHILKKSTTMLKLHEILLEKVNSTVTRPRNSPQFTENECSLPCSQQLNMSLSRVNLIQSTLPQNQFPSDRFNIIFPIKILNAFIFSSMPRPPHPQ